MTQPVSQTEPSGSDILDGISHAFAATMDRDAGPYFVALGVVAVVAGVAWLVYWVRRETHRDRQEQALLDARHAAAMSENVGGDPTHDWVTIAVERHVTVQHPERGGRFWYEEARTRSISGGEAELLCKVAPARMSPLHFSLDVGEKSPLPLRGVVEQVEPPSSPGGLSVVRVALGPLVAQEREHLVQWITLEQERQIAEARRGRLCAACQRPMADESEVVHSSCLEGRPSRRAAPR